MDNPFKSDWPDLFYKTPAPDDKRVREFRIWLHRNKMTEIVLFHGTDASLPIMEKGLLPTSTKRRRSFQSGNGYVYLSVFPSSARMFGEMGYPGRKVTVYGVRTLIKNLRADKDQLRNRRQYSEMPWVEDTLVHSLVYGYGARIKGKIEPYSLILEEHLQLDKENP